jgi:hypothetical protein
MTPRLKHFPHPTAKTLWVLFHTGCKCGCDESPDAMGTYRTVAKATEARKEHIAVDKADHTSRFYYIRGVVEQL